MSSICDCGHFKSEHHADGVCAADDYNVKENCRCAGYGKPYPYECGCGHHAHRPGRCLVINCPCGGPAPPAPDADSQLAEQGVAAFVEATAPPAPEEREDENYADAAVRVIAELKAALAAKDEEIAGLKRHHRGMAEVIEDLRQHPGRRNMEALRIEKEKAEAEGRELRAELSRLKNG